MIYLDSSALLKLLFLERETADLWRWMFDRPGFMLTSSELAKVKYYRDVAASMLTCCQRLAHSCPT